MKTQSPVSLTAQQVAALPQWQSEFRDYVAMPDEITALLAAGTLKDLSWGNDVCPTFCLVGDYRIVTLEGSAESVRVLWADYADASVREFPELARFRVYLDGIAVVETEDVSEAIAAIIPAAQKLNFPTMTIQSLQFAQETARRLQSFGESLHGLASVQASADGTTITMRVEYFASDVARDGSGDADALFGFTADLGLISATESPVDGGRGAFGPVEIYTLS